MPLSVVPSGGNTKKHNAPCGKATKQKQLGRRGHELTAHWKKKNEPPPPFTKRVRHCLKCGRKFLGFEIDPGYAKIANERIEAARKGVTVQELRYGQETLFNNGGAP